MELALSVLIVLAHFTSESSKTLPMSISSKPAGVLAAAYTAATLVSVSEDCPGAYSKSNEDVRVLNAPLITSVFVIAVRWAESRTAAREIIPVYNGFAKKSTC